MFIKFSLKLITTLILGFLMTGCRSKKENFDIDFSNLKLPKNNEVEISNSKEFESLEATKKVIENKLINYKERSEVLNSVRVGKNDPFSKNEEQINILESGFILKGFLNTEIDKYVFVRYLNSSGVITENSIGGVNTNLLPDGAKVKDIDPKNMKLTVKFENKDYTFEL